jgi:hypothetical protein
VHPSGAQYRWISPEGVAGDQPPAVDDLPNLPEAWVDGITGGKAAISQARGTRNLTAAMEWLDELDEVGAPCERTAAAKRAALADVASAKGSMHEVARNHVLRLVRLGEQIHEGVPAALEGLRTAFVASVTDKGRGGDARSDAQATNEWDRMVVAAVNLVTANPSAAQCDCGRAPLVPFLPDVPLPKIAEAKRPTKRTLTLTRASSIKMRPVRWLWENRLPLGSLSLLGGREQIGKSTIAYTLAADITRGNLPGIYQGQARAVIVAGTEDSWEHTICPRLAGAGADLDLVYRVDVTSVDGGVGPPELPVDLVDLEEAVTGEGAALVLLDPLLSRLGGNLDSHKDADVRKALEPLVAMADRTRSSILGLIHVNKSGSTDPLTALMASRAFSAVARSVLFAMNDSDSEEGIRLLGQPKSNLGPEQPILAYRIIGTNVEQEGEESIGTGKVEWLGERAGTVSDHLETAAQSKEDRSETSDAAEWLDYWLTSKGGEDASANIKKAGMASGHSVRTLQRAREKLGILSIARGQIPRTTCWALPAEPVAPGVPPAVPSVSVGTPGTAGKIVPGEALNNYMTHTVVPAVPVKTDGHTWDASTAEVETFDDEVDWNRPLRGGYL